MDRRTPRDQVDTGGARFLHGTDDQAQGPLRGHVSLAGVGGDPCRKRHGAAGPGVSSLSPGGIRWPAIWTAGSGSRPLRDRLSGHHSDGQGRCSLLGCLADRIDADHHGCRRPTAGARSRGLIGPSRGARHQPGVGGWCPTGRRADRQWATAALPPGRAGGLGGGDRVSGWTGCPGVPLASALLFFLAGSALVGAVVARSVGGPRRSASAILLTMSMRDFAVAAAIATVAFGPRAAAGLGLYGVIVLVWGTGIAGLDGRRSGPTHSASPMLGGSG